MSTSKHDLTTLSEEVWQRLWVRFAGLTDDEYFWEPAPGCWTIAAVPTACALDVVQVLVEHGADINARDPQFQATPLT